MSAKLVYLDVKLVPMEILATLVDHLPQQEIKLISVNVLMTITMMILHKIIAKPVDFYVLNVLMDLVVIPVKLHPPKELVNIVTVHLDFIQNQMI